MTPEQLMMPRVIVTNYYPNSKFEIGDILQKSPLNYYFKVGVLTSKHTVEMVEEVDKSTSIFLPLTWSADRKIEELPEYISTLWTHGVIVYHIEPANYLDKKFMEWKFGGKRINDFLPATKQDYEAYLKTKQ